MDPAPPTQDCCRSLASHQQDWELVDVDAIPDVSADGQMSVNLDTQVKELALCRISSAPESFFEHAEVLSMPQTESLSCACTCSASKLLPYYLELVSNLKNEKRALELRVKLLEKSYHLAASIKALINDICIVGIVYQAELTIGVLEFA